MIIASTNTIPWWCSSFLNAWFWGHVLWHRDSQNDIVDAAEMYYKHFPNLLYAYSLYPFKGSSKVETCLQDFNRKLDLYKSASNTCLFGLKFAADNRTWQTLAWQEMEVIQWLCTQCTSVEVAYGTSPVNFLLSQIYNSIFCNFILAALGTTKSLPQTCHPLIPNHPTEIQPCQQTGIHLLPLLPQNIQPVKYLPIR